MRNNRHKWLFKGVREVVRQSYTCGKPVENCVQGICGRHNLVQQWRANLLHFNMRWDDG